MYTERGSTLIEILILLGLIGIIGSLSIALSYSSLSRSKLETETDIFISLILFPTRMRALANIHDTSHGIHIGEDSFILFEGTTLDPHNTQNRIVQREKSVSIEGEENIVFEKLSGNVISGEGVITLTTDTASRTISVTRWGGINW